MKKHIFFLLCAVFVFTACRSGGSDGSEEYVPRTFSQSIELSSDAAEQIMLLDGLTAKPSISGATDWLRVEECDYTEGTPSIKIMVSENLSLSDRKANITAIVPTKDKYILNVTQTAHPEESNTAPNGQHDNVTDQPAYVPRRPEWR